jgi:hypothetical protein
MPMIMEIKNKVKKKTKEQNNDEYFNVHRESNKRIKPKSEESTIPI